MEGRTLSARTYLVLGVGLLSIAAVYAIILSGIGGEAGRLVASDLGESLIVIGAAAVIFRVASGFEPGEPVRRQWMLVGVGTACYAMGDLVWTYIEVVQGLDVPYPGLPDVFYVLQYPFFAVGIGLAGLGLRRLFDVRGPLAVTVVIVAALGGALYFFLLHTIMADSEVSGVEKALSLFYPLGDLVLELGPAVFILLMAHGMGRGWLAWPWRAVAAGIMVMAAADTAYALLEWNDAYVSGTPVDIGWMLGFVLVALGASIAGDIGRAAASRRTAER
jgi:hypothetical protein